MTDVSIDLDEHNRDVLYARRVEMFFEPNEDGTPSTRGKIVWHTEWWHYSGELLRGKSMGPRIEREVASVLGDQYGGVDAAAIVGGLKAAFVEHARQDLGISEPS